MRNAKNEWIGFFSEEVIEECRRSGEEGMEKQRRAREEKRKREEKRSTTATKRAIT